MRKGSAIKKSFLSIQSEIYENGLLLAAVKRDVSRRSLMLFAVNAKIKCPANEQPWAGMNQAVVTPHSQQTTSTVPSSTEWTRFSFHHIYITCGRCCTGQTQVPGMSIKMRKPREKSKEETQCDKDLGSLLRPANLAKW